MNSQIFESVWMTVLSFEALLFTIAIAFILLAMAKERTELRHKTAALVDSLTGIANRRAFMEGGALLARRHESHPKPAAVLLIDLDHFKQINDTFGHAHRRPGAAGLCRQCERQCHVPAISSAGWAARNSRALLYDCDKPKALAMAEQIRAAFAAQAVEVDGRPVNATVSVGVAVCEQGPLDVSTMLAQADQALYHAKERGRNRVELASLDLILRLDANTPSLRIDALASHRAA